MDHAFAVLNVPKAPRFREAAYTAIKEAILDARLSGDEPLIEERIAAALGISRTPVREALAILEHEGLIAARSGKGLFIRELSREEFFDMFSANEVIEPYLARRAASLATDVQLDELQAAIDRGIEAAGSVNLNRSLQSGREFHHWMAVAAGNESLRHLVARNEEQTDLFLLSLGNPALISGLNLEISNKEHQDILDAIRRRNPEAAANFVIVHAQSLRTRWANLFRSEGGNEKTSADNVSMRSR
ncbi:MAG: GntR family transcriptional regulator [Thermomicrobiales bacterium]